MNNPRKAHVIRDATYPTMWRVRWPDGSLSDMVNLSRANDAAARFNETIQREQRGRQRPQEPDRSRSPIPQAPGQPTAQITSPSSLAA
jgi:hypothetical protein